MQHLYFINSLRADLLPDNDERKPVLKKKLNRIFHTLIFPFTFTIVILFWGAYFQDIRYLDKYGAVGTKILPFYNHLMHTAIIPIAVLELFIVDHPHDQVSFMDCFKTGILVDLVYCTVIYIYYFLGGAWPYPFFGMLSVPLLLFLMVLLVAVTVLIWSAFCWIKDSFSQRNKVKHS